MTSREKLAATKSPEWLAGYYATMATKSEQWRAGYYAFNTIPYPPLPASEEYLDGWWKASDDYDFARDRNPPRGALRRPEQTPSRKFA